MKKRKAQIIEVRNDPNYPVPVKVYSCVTEPQLSALGNIDAADSKAVSEMWEKVRVFSASYDRWFNMELTDAKAGTWRGPATEEQT